METADATSSPTPGLAVCGDLMVATGGTKLLAARYKEPSNDDLFIYDCTTSKGSQENQGKDGKSANKASNDILACAFSSSGTYFALTDDNKRLILFRTKPCWEFLSVRSVVRRCTSLIITAAEDKILVGDKSGDVYSFSVTEPENTGTIELGHLSLLLDVALSPDDQYILTADRDEKIRVSLTGAPHNIVSFCLGHREWSGVFHSITRSWTELGDCIPLGKGALAQIPTESEKWSAGLRNVEQASPLQRFVSRIFVIPNYPDLLLSASGDCTLRLWEYKSGKEVHCCQLNSMAICEATTNEQKYAVSRIAYCCEGNYIAILYDCLPAVSIFQLDTGAQNLTYKQHISLNHNGWGIAFEETGGLWVLQEDKQAPLLFYQPVDGQWQPTAEAKGLMKMSKYIRDNWIVFEGCVGKGSCYQNLYKSSFDNMAVYLQKKEERLQQHKTKRKDPQRESNGQTKKVRTDAPSL